MNITEHSDFTSYSIFTMPDMHCNNDSFNNKIIMKQHLKKITKCIDNSKCAVVWSFPYFWYVWNTLSAFSVPCLIVVEKLSGSPRIFLSKGWVQGIVCTQCFFWLLSQKEARYQENYIEVSPRSHVIWGNVLLDAQITISLHSGIQKVTRLAYC